MRHGALFNGIGGFQLAAHWMGWENIFHCEIDKFCNQVVKKHFPESICYEDIKQTDFTKWRGAIDVLTGGFPCQKFSLNGKGSMDLFLWKEMLRAVREIRPGWIVAENVYGLVVRKRGVALESVYADLENEGYETIPPLILPAAGIGMDHRRDRVWIVAYACGERRQSVIQPQSNNGSQESARIRPEPYKLLERPTPRRLRGMEDGISNWVDRVGALGNAIVPQVAFEIFKAIQAYENL